MKKYMLLLAILATSIASWLLASPKEDFLKDFGRIASFSTHAKMIKNGEIEKAVCSLEGLMEQGYLEMKKSILTPKV